MLCDNLRLGLTPLMEVALRHALPTRIWPRSAALAVASLSECAGTQTSPTQIDVACI